MNWTRFSGNFSPVLGCCEYFITFQYNHGREVERLWYFEEYGGWFDNSEANDSPLEPNETWLAWLPTTVIEPFQG